jgi:hypothetical protein
LSEAGEPAPEPEPFEAERSRMDRLHFAIWGALGRKPPLTPTPNTTQQPYHPAYMASRLQQLETVVGVLAAILLDKGLVTQDELFALLGETYAGQLQDLELHAAIHNVAYRLAPFAKPNKP